MAINFLNSIDFNQIESLHIRIENQANDTAAGTSVDGQLYYNTSNNVLKVSDGSNGWKEVGGGVESLTAGTYINLTGTATDPTINHDTTTRSDTTSASSPAAGGTFQVVDSVTSNGTGHVTAINVKTVTLPADTDTTYDLTTAPTGTAIRLTGSDTTNDDVTISGTANEVEVTRISASELRAGLPNDVTITGKLTVSGTGQSSFGGQVTVPPVPSASTDAASKAYVDGLVSGGLTFKGTFRADTGEVISGTNDGNFLYSCPGGAGSRVAVAVGDYYVVATDGGSFYCSGATLDIGDSIIGVTAAAADSSTATNWSIVQSDEGVTDISASVAADLTGINVSAATGSVAVGLSINSLGTGTLPLAGQIEIPYVDTNGPENKKATLEDLVEKANSVTSKTGTITAGDLSGTVNHTFGINTLVQTINSSGDTVFCDVTRTATTSVATIAVAEAADITILVQKIG